MKKNSIIFFVMILLTACATKKNALVETLTAKEFYEKLQQVKDKQLIDVRTEQEMQNGYIEGAVLIDYNAGNFENEISKLDKGKTTFVYCKGGGRSSEAATILKNKGFEKVYNLQGGLLSWGNNNLPLITSNAATAATTNISNTSVTNRSNLSLNDFNAIAASNTVVIIDFYAPWCGPCKRLSPMLEQFEKEYGNKIKVVKINVDENAALANQFRIESIPLVFFYKNGKLVNQLMGLPEKKEIKMEIENLVN